MAKVEHTYQKKAHFYKNWRFGVQNNVRWSRKLSLIERGYFFGNNWKLVKNGSLILFFLFPPQLWLNWSLHIKNEHNWTKIDDLVTKTMFRGRRSSDTFLEIGKNLSKTVRSVQFFDLIANYGLSRACPSKLSTIVLKLTIWWPKQCSVIEKVKPHRARILFWRSLKT